MSGIWNLIRRALNEATGKEQLLAYITRKYGEHEADELAPYLNRVWNPKQLPQVAQELSIQFADPQVGEIMRNAMKAMGIEVPGAKRGRGRPPGSGAGQTSKEPPPPEKKYVDPDQAKAAAAKAAEVGASRPDRQAGADDPFSWVQKPPKVPTPTGDEPVGHRFGGVRGTSPGHTRPPQVQPSLDVKPSEIAKQLEPLKKREKDLERQVAGFSADPSQEKAAGRAKAELSKVQQQIAQITNVGVSGLEQAQQHVDALNKRYPDSMPGDKIAKQLGVPTTKERTRKVKYTDKETGEEKEKIVIQIWNADKIYQHMNRQGYSQSGMTKGPSDDELEPGQYDPVPVMGGNKYKPGGRESDKPAQWHTGKDLPVSPTDKATGAARPPAGVQPPTMKAPKGLDDAGIERLASLRQQYSKVKKTADGQQVDKLTKQIKVARNDRKPAEEVEQLMAQLDSLKSSSDGSKAIELAGQIDQIMGSGDELIDVIRPGTKHGIRWNPNGVSRKVKTTRGDQATGNFQHGSRYTNPAEEGDELVWDANKKKWVPDSVFDAKEDTVHEGRVWTGRQWVLPSVWVTRRR